VKALLAVLLLALAPAASATASDPAPEAKQEGEVELGFSAAARVSVALPMGGILSDAQTGTLLISDIVALSVPVQLDFGLTLDRRLFLGGYAQWGWNFLQIGGCEVGQSCTLSGLRAGIEAIWSFHAEGDTPWVGLGTGWEWLFTAYSSSSYRTSLDVSGWEFVNLQAGYDVQVAPRWKVGGFVSGSVGEFSRAALRLDGTTTEGPIPGKAVHGWLQVGVKGTFGP
jgi:hypothetical protein